MFCTHPGRDVLLLIRPSLTLRPQCPCTIRQAQKSGSGALAAEGETLDEELQYVLKEGKKIGGAYYLVEMATDGRTLTISACACGCADTAAGARSWRNFLRAEKDFVFLNSMYP